MKRKMMPAAILFLLVFTHAHAQIDPMPSWNDGRRERRRSSSS